MSFLLTRTFVTDCPAKLKDYINTDAGVGAFNEQIINDGGPTTDFWFTTEPSPTDITNFDAILATWDCDKIQQPPADDVLALDHKRDKIAGIVGRGSSWLDFDFNTNELTIVANPNFYSEGVGLDEFILWTYNKRYTKTSNSIIVPTTSPNYLIYYNESGVLSAIPTDAETDEIAHNASVIARTSANTIDNKTLFVIDLRYDVDMDPETRNTFIKTVGTSYNDGLALLNIIADGSGDLDTHAQFSVEDGSIFLADITYKTVQRTQVLSFPAQIPVWYKIGLEWNLSDATAFPMIYQGSVPEYTGTRLPYNNIDSAGNGTLVEVNDKDYVCCHYFAATGLYRSVVGVQGQFQYDKVDEARRGAEREVADLLTSENISKFYTPIATVIYQTALNKSNTPHAEIVSYVDETDEGSQEKFDYYDLRTLKGALGSGAGTPTPVINNLDSTSASNALSANMGRVLNEKIPSTVALHFYMNS